MNTVIPRLKQLLNDIDIKLFPYQKGNAIYIGNTCIRKSNRAYKIFQNKKYKTETFTKVAALSLARSDFSVKIMHDVKTLDDKIRKNYNDCVFYKNSMEQTKDNFKKQVLETRYEIGAENMNQAAEHLSNIFFSIR